MLMFLELDYSGFDGIRAFEYESVEKAQADLFAVITRLQQEQRDFKANFKAESALRDQLRDQVIALQMNDQAVPPELREQYHAEVLRVQAIWQSQSKYEFEFAGMQLSLADFESQHDWVPQTVYLPMMGFRKRYTSPVFVPLIRFSCNHK